MLISGGRFAFPGESQPHSALEQLLNINDTLFRFVLATKSLRFRTISVARVACSLNCSSNGFSRSGAVSASLYRQRHSSILPLAVG